MFIRKILLILKIFILILFEKQLGVWVKPNFELCDKLFHAASAQQDLKLLNWYLQL